MEIKSIKEDKLVKELTVGKNHNQEGEFPKVLDKQVSEPNGSEERMAKVAQGQEKVGGRPNFVELGTISKGKPTVSDLLVRHPVYGKDIWSIVHSEQNRQKPFTEMQVGTRVYLNQETLELVWNKEGLFPYGSEKAGEESPSFVELGTISKGKPTVSDLLVRHPVYGKDTWNIIHSEQNRQKQFTEMQVGTRVYLDPETLELVWDTKSPYKKPNPKPVETDKFALKDQRAAFDEADSFSEGLVKAVKSYVGSPYKNLDCFELVVQGLKKLGVRYQGRGGLGERLIRMAVGKGLPYNAYFSGEGLIKASGSEVYFKSIPRIRDSEMQALSIFREMQPHLKEGFILSFSTPTRGHTGIVSQKNQRWTYVNSGKMDHNIGTSRSPEGVGEEYLMEEIMNWFRLASENKESLKITLGQLNESKLRSHIS